MILQFLFLSNANCCVKPNVKVMRMSFLFFSFDTLLWLAMTSVVNEITCNEWKSCASSNLSDSGSTNIECYGYQSCWNSSILATGTAYTRCSGAYSCAQSIVQQGGDNDIRCYGFQSCSYSNVSFVRGSFDWQYIHAFGASSLVNSNVTLTNSNLNCLGERSCADSCIVGTAFHFMFGHLSGQNSIFRSGDSSVSYSFIGTRSGQNATILCGTNHTCTVHCHGNGCHGLNLTCIDGSGTCELLRACTYAEYICPHGYKLSSFMGDVYLPDISNVSLRYNDYETGLQDCSKGTTVQNTNTDFCNDYQGCTCWPRIKK